MRRPLGHYFNKEAALGLHAPSGEAVVADQVSLVGEPVGVGSVDRPNDLGIGATAMACMGADERFVVFVRFECSGCSPADPDWELGPHVAPMPTPCRRGRVVHRSGHPAAQIPCFWPAHLTFRRSH